VDDVAQDLPASVLEVEQVGAEEVPDHRVVRSATYPADGHQSGVAPEPSLFETGDLPGVRTFPLVAGEQIREIALFWRGRRPVFP